VAAGFVAVAGWTLFKIGPAAAAPTPLIGTFTVTPGSCSGGLASGTYLRMVLSGGTNSSGPYFSNSDSSCSDHTVTPLSPGTAGGLVTGSYQPQPSPAFDGAGNALSHQITTPVAFEGVKFATATNSVDPQTGAPAPAPTITANGTALSGNLESFGVSWNNQEFNQGSPKPGGSAPGNTTPVVGTYNVPTGSYTLQWSSQVVGGPFNGFSAFWNLTGRFIPAASSSGGSAGASGGVASGVLPGSGATTAPSSGHSSTAGSTAGATPTVGVTPTTATPSGSIPGGAPPGATGTGSDVRTAQSSRTITTGQGGWSPSSWLIALAAIVGAFGLGGVMWSERALRRQRPLTLRVEGR
jgi:hypothetical protein